MRIWIYKLSEFTPWDIAHYGERKFRYTMLAEALVEAGHEVMWWTDDFQHFKKDKGHRFSKDHFEEVAPGLMIRWVYSAGYKRNVSRRRFRDHQIVADKMLCDADNWPKPDLILGAMPTDTMSAVAVQVGAKYVVPVVLDVRDQWPDIFFSQLPAFARPLIWALSRKMERSIRDSFSKATAVTGNTDAFVDWGLKKGNRARGNLERAFPIGYSKSSNLDNDAVAGKQFWQKYTLGADDGSFKICFLGTFSKMYDFAPVLKAARELIPDKKPVKFILCGDGPDLKRLEKAAEGLPSIILPGRISGNEIHALLSMSSVGLIPYINHDNFGNNIANKPAEYLSADLPIFISIGGILTDLLEKYECGTQYKDGKELASKIRELRDYPEILKKHREGANRLFSEKLDADMVYKEFAGHLEFVEGSFRK
jgi:glycosyltransferase involved in cell wall biosynthesis